MTWAFSQRSRHWATRQPPAAMAGPKSPADSPHLAMINRHAASQRDMEGAELPNLKAVRMWAEALVHGIAAEDRKAGRVRICSQIDVRDELGRVILSVPFADVDTIDPPPN